MSERSGDDTFCTPDTTQSRVVLVDAELKKLANEYVEAWHQCNADWIEEHLPDLRARFLNQENAGNALIRAREYAAYVFKKGVSKVKLPLKPLSENLQLPIQTILPEIFSWPARDIAAATEEHDVKRGCDVEAAKLYLAIFDGTNFKRLVLEAAKTEITEERKTAFENLQRAHNALILYLRAMLKRSCNHIVKIRKDLTVEIDGRIVACKGAPRRALFSLALMRAMSPFKVTDFNNLFYGAGHCEGEPASEFTTAMRAAKTLLPGLDYESSKGLRSITGVHFVVLASDEQLKQSIVNAAGVGAAN